LVPEVVKSLAQAGAAEIVLERGAGLLAGFADDEYEKAGAKIVSRREVCERARYLLAINGAEFFAEADLKGKVLISLFDPYFQREGLMRLKDMHATALSLELLPRISRAQSMDVLSSQANIAGYAAVVLAASKLPKVIPLMMTAAGTIKPAKILIVGAGVAGLQAIATAKRLGAVVYAYDVRSVVKEQIESLGGKFVEISINESAEGSGGYAKALSDKGQQELREKLGQFAKDMDVVITTAQIPGRRAPLLLSQSGFSLMQSDAIVIDMAAATGGNVEGSVLGEWRKLGNASVYGAGNLACMMPKDASFTFSKNIFALLELLSGEVINTDDEILKDALVCHKGNWVNQAYRKFVEGT
jgi:NAD(P) transhydrogenase subunit alpha